VLLLTAGRMVGYGVSFILPIVLVRLFSPSEFGTYKQVFLILSMFVGIGQIGMAESLYYFLPRKPHLAGRYVANTVLMLAVSGLLCLAVSWFGAAHVAQWWSNPALTQYIPILGVFIFLSLASVAFETVLVSENRYGSAALFYALTDSGRALIFVGFAMATRNLWWLLAGAVAYGAMRCGAMVTYLVRRFKSELRADAGLWKEQLMYAVPFTIAAWASFNPQSFLVAARVDTATFAVYAVGCLDVPIVEMLATSYGNVLMVKMGEASRVGRSAVGLWHQTTERLALVCVPLVVALILTAHELMVGLFTKTYSGSAPVFQVYALMILLATLPTDAVLRSYAETKMLILLYALRLTVILGGMSWAIGRFGLRGAVVVTLVATALMKAAALLRIAHLMQLRMRDVLPWRGLGKIVAAALIAVVPAAAVKAHLGGWHPIPVGAVTTIAYGLVYLALAVALGLVPRLTAVWPRWPLVSRVEGE
jgi:O-antigen/teichoic acid export membrane protein